MRAKTLREQFVDLLWLEGGFSWRHDSPAPTTGYMVGVDGVCIVPANTPLTKSQLEDVMRQLLDYDNLYLGGWRDDGKDYYDLSQNFPTLEEALLIARERGELAVWDVEAGKEVYV